MTDIRVQRQMKMTQEQAMEAAIKVADKLAREYGVNFLWQGASARINGPGVKGNCEVTDGNVDIRLSLGFLVAPFAAKVEAEIERYFDKLEQE